MWLNSKISDEELEIEGYNLLRKDRAYTNGGSVVVYIKNRYTFKCRPEFESGISKMDRTFIHTILPLTGIPIL